MRQRIHEQLHEAINREGLSLPELLEKSGLKMTRSTLHRKLCGVRDLRTKEAEAIVDTLRTYGVNVTLMWPPRLSKRAA